MNAVAAPAAKLVVFIAVVAACAAFVVSALHTPVPPHRVGYQALFTDVSGLSAGNTVRMSGVAVGTVDSVRLDGTLARVGFTVDRARPLYDNTRAAVRYQDLVGQRYVELIPAPAPGHPLASNATIPVERTIASFDVSRLFNGFKPLFDTLDTAQLNRLGQNLLRVLRGDGSGIGPVLADVEQLTRHARDSETVIVVLIRNLGEIAQSIGGKSAAVGDLVNQLGAILRQFSTRTTEILTSVEKANRTMGPLIPLLEQLRSTYDDNYTPLDALLRRMLPQTDQIVEILSLMPSLLSGLDHAIPDAGRAPALTCTAGPVAIPDIGQAILADQHLVVCR